MPKHRYKIQRATVHMVVYEAEDINAPMRYIYIRKEELGEHPPVIIDVEAQAYEVKETNVRQGPFLKRSAS